MARVFAWIPHENARHRFSISLAIAAVTFFAIRGHLSIVSESVATWDPFAFCGLSLAWLTIFTIPQDRLCQRAQDQDVGGFAIFIFVVSAACAALIAVGFLIRAHRAEAEATLTWSVVLALMTVAFSWLLVHTVFGLRYAHIYYGDLGDQGGKEASGGLDFPGDRMPDYFDFAYFSFVIGMTCQVSDVQVTSKRMRRLTLMHGVLAFGFNTVILALLVNTVSSLV
jgi:uncharacterized membrane protein